MSNPFEDFKNRYAGVDAIATSLSASASYQMESAYESLYNAIYRELSVAKKDVHYATYAKQAQLLKQVGVELDKFKSKSGSYLMKALKKISEYGTKVSIKDLETLYAGTTKSDEWHYDYNRKYAEQVFKDNFAHIAAQTDKIKATVKAQLQADAAMVLRRAAVEGLTRRDAHRALREQIDKTMPSFQFIDKAGRAWDSKNYFDMLTKTTMASTLREVYANTLINEGHDLVKITQNGATDACKNWEGVVVSLTGATPAYPSMEDARATGEVFHPRCRHRFVAYDPEIDDVFKQVEQGGSDAEILGFDLDEYLSDGPKQKALKALENLPKNDSGETLNPFDMAHSKTIAGIELTYDMAAKYAIEIVPKKETIEIDDIKASSKTISKVMVNMDINNPAEIGALGIKVSKINGKYVADSSSDLVAAKLLGVKTIEVNVFDLDLAYKQAMAAKKKADKLEAQKEKELKAKADALMKAAIEKAAPQVKADKLAAEFADAKHLYDMGMINKAELDAKVKAIYGAGTPEKPTTEAPKKPMFKEDDFERIGPQQGSNEGALYQHKKTGKKYYIKTPKDPGNTEKVFNERVASEIYKLGGAKVPKLHEMTLSNGKKAIVSEWEDNLRRPTLLDENLKAFHKDFGLDAFLANWDVVGAEIDNIAFDSKGRPVRIDVGGSLLFRAQGEPKGSKFGNIVAEIETLFTTNSSYSEKRAKVFAGMSKADVIKSLERVAKLDMDEVFKIIDTLAPSTMSLSTIRELKETLHARHKYVREYIVENKGKKPKMAKASKLDNIVDEYAWAHKEPTEEDRRMIVERYSPIRYSYAKELNILKKLHPSLTEDERLAYVAYTNGHYSALNEMIKNNQFGKDTHADSEMVAFTKVLNSAIRKATVNSSVKGKAKGPWEDAKPEYYERKWNSRRPESIERALQMWSKVGNISHANSFLSTSQERTSFTGNMRIYFKPKRGYAYADPFSAHHGEDEVVVPAGVRVKVVHYMTRPSSRYGQVHTFYLEEI